MNTQIQLRLVKLARPPDELHSNSQEIIAIGKPEGVEVLTGDFSRGMIEWSKLEDVEVLANTFAILQVWQFVPVVELLGEMSRMKDKL
jgi:hypothetical protein